MIERAHVDVQISTAHRFPRSMEVFKKRASDMVAIDRETAESCIYRRPVGKDAETGRQKIAEGMSIRMAEIVGASYGNLRVSSRIIEQTPRFVRVEAVAHDLESNYAAKSEVIEATVDKRGNPYSERQRAVVAKAALSKAHRDATFKVVPKALCKPILAQAMKIINGGRTLEDRRKAAVDWIKSLKIDERRVWAVLNVNGAADLGDAHLVDLLGLKTAIDDGDATLDESFPPLVQEKSGLGELLKGKADGAPSQDGSTNAATTTTPEDRDAITAELKELMLNHEVSESRLWKYAQDGKHVPEGIDELWTLPTAVLSKLRAAVPALSSKKGGK
jgi:hypothetical protein